MGKGMDIFDLKKSRPYCSGHVLQPYPLFVGMIVYSMYIQNQDRPYFHMSYVKTANKDIGL